MLDDEIELLEEDVICALTGKVANNKAANTIAAIAKIKYPFVYHVLT